MSNELVDNSNKNSSCNEEFLNTIYKDSLKYAPSKLIGTILNIFSVYIYTNLLLPKDYGLYMIATSVISFLAIIFSDWIGVSALRFFKKHFDSDNIQSYFSTVFLLLIINIAALYISAFIFLKPIESFFNIPRNFLFMVLALLIPIALRALLFQILRAQIKPLTYTFSVIFNQILTIIVAIILISKFNMDATAILAGMAISIIVVDILMLFQTKYYRSVHYEKIHFETLSGLYRYGLPIALSSIGIWLITQSNRFILQHFKGSYYNGQLGVGYNLTYSVMMPLFAIITLAAIPRLINRYEEGKNVEPYITKLTEIYFSYFFPVAMFLCIYPKQVLAFLANTNFSNAYIIIPFLAISAFCLGLTELTTLQYYLAKKTQIDMFIRLASGFVGIVLNLLLLPKYGLIAVGVSALFSQFFYLVLSSVIKIKSINWSFPIRAVLKSFLAILICICISFVTKKLLPVSNIYIFILHIFIYIVVYYIGLRQKIVLEA